MEAVGVEEWIDSIAGDHSFGSERKVKTYHNANVEIKLQSNVTVEMTNGKVFEFAAGSRIGVFRAYQGHGYNVVATVFRDDDRVVIYQGGRAVVRRNVVEYTVMSRSHTAVIV